MVLAALEKGFTALGFTAHSDMLSDPHAYVTEVRELAVRYSDRIRILCGLELELAKPTDGVDRSLYDYLIGSVHFISAPDGGFFAIDALPEDLEDGVEKHFSGDWESFICSYYAAIRDTLSVDFDIVGHPDLIRKFNTKYRFFDESSVFYRAQLEATADAIAASGKLVEVNTGAISRGWMDDAYPSKAFRELLEARGVHFILSSDAHASDALDCAFDRFSQVVKFVSL